MKRLRRKNPRQASCIAALESFGFLPTGRGMPTFFAVRHNGGTTAFVFLARSAKLKTHQKRIADVFHQANLCVLVWTGTNLVAYRDFQFPPMPDILKEPEPQPVETYP